MSASTPAQIATRRKALGLSQRALAELIRVHRVTLASWELGAHAPLPEHAQQADAALDALEVGFKFARLAAATAGAQVGSEGRP